MADINLEDSYVSISIYSKTLNIREPVELAWNIFKYRFSQVFTNSSPIRGQDCLGKICNTEVQEYELKFIWERIIWKIYHLKQ